MSSGNTPLTDGGQPLDPEHYEMMSNAGRCDICGEPIDMESGDNLVLSEYGVEDEITEEHGITDQDAADGVADALERVGDSGADYDLAETIRSELAIRVHRSCLDETAYDKLTVPADEAEEWSGDG